MVKVKPNIFKWIEIKENNCSFFFGTEFTFPIFEIEHVDITKVNDIKKCLSVKFLNFECTYFFNFKDNLENDVQEIYNILKPYTARIMVNEQKSILRIVQKNSINEKPILVPFSKINSFQIIKDEVSVYKGGVYTGTSLSGNVSSLLIGTSSTRTERKKITNLQIQVNLNSFDLPCITINYLRPNNTYYSEIEYAASKLCLQDAAILENICKLNRKAENQQSVQTNDPVPLNEILELKKLLDMGIINQDEFDIKKKQLLGL